MLKKKYEKLEAAQRKTQIELAETKLVLGTLIAWLARELGTENAEKLIKQLNVE